MPKSLSEAQLNEILDDEDDFGSGIADETPKGRVAEPEEADEIDEDPEIAPAESEEVEEEQVTLRSIFGKRGVNIPDDADEEEYLGQVLDQVSQMGRNYQQLQAQSQQYQQQLAQYQYMLAQRSQPEPQQPQKPPEYTGALAHWKTVPEWHDDWRSLVTRNEQGELVAKPGADPSLPQKIMARQNWEERALRSMLENPQQFIFEALKAHPDFQQIQQYREQSQQELRAYQDQVESQWIAQQRFPHLYTQDASGNNVPTQAGRVYLAAAQRAEEEAKRLGFVPDTKYLDGRAWEAALPYVMAAQQQAQKPPETPAEKKKGKQIQLLKANAKSSNKTRKRTPAPKFGGDLDAMNQHALAMMRNEGIDPYELAGVR